MAIETINKDNTNPPDSDYLYGSTKDDDGSGDGTPANKKTFNDFFEFFSKLLGLSGITPNGLPENEYSGHQYIDALTVFVKKIVACIFLEYVDTATRNVNNVAYTDISPSIQVTTPNDGIHRTYMAIFSCYNLTTSAGVDATIDLQLTDGSTQFARQVSGKESASTNEGGLDMPMSFGAKLVNVAPNTVIKIQGKYGTTAGTIRENRLQLIEIKQ